MSEQILAKAGAAGTLEDICHDYQSSLEDLNFNSKPHINMLTIVAEENLPLANTSIFVFLSLVYSPPMIFCIFIHLPANFTISFVCLFVSVCLFF
uniref:Uncharacterized protein n=1 Tax=Peromyscus maniculatus bairdii TaxID=230844 RepID=A0A8C8W166_PERMB